MPRFDSSLKRKSKEENKAGFIDQILRGNPRWLYLKIDTDYPPEKIIKTLRPFLQSRPKNIPHPGPKMDATFSYTMEFQKPYSYHPHKRPPMKDIQGWLDYFACYDLRHRDAWTYGDIAECIYNDKTGQRDRAETAVRRVTKLLQKAETDSWPPPSNYLSFRL